MSTEMLLWGKEEPMQVPAESVLPVLDRVSTLLRLVLHGSLP